MEEAERLENLIPGCRRMVLEGHGHAPLFDGRVDISEIIKSDPALEGVNFPTVSEELHCRRCCRRWYSLSPHYTISTRNFRDGQGSGWGLHLFCRK